LGEYIGPLTGVGEFYKNGTKIFTSLMIAGLAGIFLFYNFKFYKKKIL